MLNVLSIEGSTSYTSPPPTPASSETSLVALRIGHQSAGIATLANRSKSFSDFDGVGDYFLKFGSALDGDPLAQSAPSSARSVASTVPYSVHGQADVVGG